MFDVAALERTPAGKQMLRDQLLPVLKDETSTKVTHYRIDPRIRKSLINKNTRLSLWRTSRKTDQ